MKTLKNILIIVLLAILALLAWPQIKTFLGLDVQVKVMPDIQQFEKPFQPQATPTVFFDPMPLVLELRNQSMLVTAVKVIQRVDSIEYNQDGNFVERMQSEKIEMLFTGEVSAGVDLRNLTEADIRVDGMVITLWLPPAQVYNSPVVREDFVLSHKKGLFTEILGREDPNLQSYLRARVTLEMIETARQDMVFMKTANDQAVDIISGLANSLVPDSYQVIVIPGGP